MMKWKNFIAQIPRRFRESYTNGIAQQTGMSMKEIKPVFKSGRCEHNCVYVTVKYCATQEFIFESCLLKTRVVNLTFTNKHIYHSCTHLSLFPPPPTGLCRFPSVWRRSIRPAALPTAGPRHRPAHHVHRSRPAEQPRQRLPGLLHLHHDMLLPASRNCRPHLFNPSEFN